MTLIGRYHVRRPWNKSQLRWSPETTLQNPNEVPQLVLKCSLADHCVPLSGPGHFTQLYATMHIISGTIWTPLPWLPFLTNATCSKHLTSCRFLKACFKMSDALLLVRHLQSANCSFLVKMPNWACQKGLWVWGYIKQTGVHTTVKNWGETGQLRMANNVSNFTSAVYYYLPSLPTRRHFLGLGTLHSLNE